MNGFNKINHFDIANLRLNIEIAIKVEENRKIVNLMQANPYPKLRAHEHLSRGIFIFCPLLKISNFWNELKGLLRIINQKSELEAKQIVSEFHSAVLFLTFKSILSNFLSQGRINFVKRNQIGKKLLMNQQTPFKCHLKFFKILILFIRKLTVSLRIFLSLLKKFSEKIKK
ncbi:hypothetical protein BpHYR1_015509 [Brachionus plicatilis]|uniref:Uncharacterized protein n=1 Tax=Brachionus plicatilis TaxID=10195 RepID=A0A3M7PRL3_BRAPC|nr:hypothetical protein BpHYR1_015509 [Brachionus plicatilis]